MKRNLRVRLLKYSARHHARHHARARCLSVVATSTATARASRCYAEESLLLFASIRRAVDSSYRDAVRSLWQASCALIVPRQRVGAGAYSASSAATRPPCSPAPSTPAMVDPRGRHVSLSDPPPPCRRPYLLSAVALCMHSRAAGDGALRGLDKVRQSRRLQVPQRYLDEPPAGVVGVGGGVSGVATGWGRRGRASGGHAPVAGAEATQPPANIAPPFTPSAAPTACSTLSLTPPRTDLPAAAASARAPSPARAVRCAGAHGAHRLATR